jgi:hypothetical protein
MFEECNLCSVNPFYCNGVRLIEFILPFIVIAGILYVGFILWRRKNK